MTKRAPWLLAVVALWATGCETTDDKGGDTDAATDVDGDADTDTDSDSDTDADADADADTDTDTDTGTLVVDTCPQTVTDPHFGAIDGCITGRTADGVEGFMGIPYAAPPVGELRWAPPQPPAAWSTPLAAVDHSEPCVQTYGTLDLDHNAGEGSEDCLYLNVLRPEGTTQGEGLPILFWAHGGSHIDGSGHQFSFVDASFNAPSTEQPLFPGAPNLVDSGVIVVTHNYRLGALGWLSHPGMEPDFAAGGIGNQGLMDTHQALQWVKDNAAAMGGDPDRIVAFGHSAGSTSVCTLLTVDGIDELISGAILQSGSCQFVAEEVDAPLGLQGYNQGNRIAGLLGCDAGTPEEQLDCMRQVPAPDVIEAGVGRSWGLDINAEAYGPIVDGTIVARPTMESFANGNVADVPVTLGFTRNEAEFFTTFVPVNNVDDLNGLLAAVALINDWPIQEFQQLYAPANFGNDLHEAYTAAASEVLYNCPVRAQGRLLQPHTEVRGYRWDKVIGLFPTLGAYHGVELPFVFGTGLLLGDELTASDNAIDAWRSIAEGAPMAAGAAWPLLDLDGPSESWVTFDVGSSVISDFEGSERCDWMDAQGFFWE